MITINNSYKFITQDTQQTSFTNKKMHNFTSINTIHSHPQIKLQIKITINPSHNSHSRWERKRKIKRERKKEKERNIVRLSERCTKGGGAKEVRPSGEAAATVIQAGRPWSWALVIGHTRWVWVLQTFFLFVLKLEILGF